MTHLRKTMLEELERRNFSQNTTRTYIRIVEDFARYFHRQPDQLGPEHIREYQAHLFRQRKLAANTVTQHVAAIRFLFVKTLKKLWSVAETPHPKRAVHLPAILSQDDVACLIDAALSPFHRVVLMTLYATGVRRAELAHLKISDIDSQRMVIHVQGGKGRKDRDVMLSPKVVYDLLFRASAETLLEVARTACCGPATLTWICFRTRSQFHGHLDTPRSRLKRRLPPTSAVSGRLK